MFIFCGHLAVDSLESSSINESRLEVSELTVPTSSDTVWGSTVSALSLARPREAAAISPEIASNAIDVGGSNDSSTAVVIPSSSSSLSSSCPAGVLSGVGGGERGPGLKGRSQPSMTSVHFQYWSAEAPHGSPRSNFLPSLAPGSVPLTGRDAPSLWTLMSHILCGTSTCGTSYTRWRLSVI